ncbi:endolytic transglycosylase MltG [Candidatus Parcubacteria bacterium]|nr:endolytic transglycosylase MltG [Candidatus Parcubacteria bacterium]
MKTYAKIIIGFLLVAACLLFFAWQGIYLAKSTETQYKVFVVEKGQGLFQIASNLEEQDLIKNKIFFEIYLTWQQKSRLLQAGKYLLSASMSVPEIAAEILRGKSNQEKITIIEGWDSRDIAQYLENKEMFQYYELFEFTGFPMRDYTEYKEDFSSEFNFLQDRPKNAGLEGYLFPDTYYLSNEMSIENIIRMMLVNFDSKLTADTRQEIEKQNKTIFDIVTMASIIEKEVRTQEDKRLVSGILWKRIENNMPLQSCATVVYITNQKTTKISIQDTKIDSPYNTYKYRGLPAGPICNPGEESILAAIYPEDSAFWYHLSTPEGETIFSRNLEEHNIAKAKYLK